MKLSNQQIDAFLDKVLLEIETLDKLYLANELALGNLKDKLNLDKNSPKALELLENAKKEASEEGRRRKAALEAELASNSSSTTTTASARRVRNLV